MLGFVQGIVEWLPVSSQGVLSAIYILIEGRSFEEAVHYALWLHLGTAITSMVVFRREVQALVSEAFTFRNSLSPLFIFILFASITSFVVALPILLIVDDFSSKLGVSAMITVGFFMLITGCIQLTKKEIGTRDRSSLSIKDAIIVGLFQGIAILPGLSRSGLTVAAFLGRKFDKREALAISFIMSIPASLAAVLFTVFDSSLVVSTETLVSLTVAFVTGVFAIKFFLHFARKVNFGIFVILVGLVMILSSILV